MRARARHSAPAAPRVETVDREERADRPRPRYRGAPGSAGGARAVGDPSPALDKAAALERGYVVKDFARLGKVVAVTLILLIVGGFAAESLVR